MKSILIFAVLLTGCATNSDVASIQSQVDALSVDVKAVQVSASDAKYASLKAKELADGATRWASIAEQSAKDTNAKLDSLFAYSQQK